MTIEIKDDIVSVVMGSGDVVIGLIPQSSNKSAAIVMSAGKEEHSIGRQDVPAGSKVTDLMVGPRVYLSFGRLESLDNFIRALQELREKGLDKPAA